MGGCATKPKVLKDEEKKALAPAMAPETAKEEVAGGTDTPINTVSSQAKDVVVVEEDDKKKNVEDENVDEAAAGNIIEVNKEIVDDEKVDGDQEAKPRSLGNLFKNEQVMDLPAAESAPSEPVKEETKEAEKPKEEYETTKLEAQKSEVPPTLESFIDATETTEPAPTKETKSEESSQEKTEAATESAEKKIEEVATELKEKKTDEAK